MQQRVRIFVEGEEDKNFLESYICHLGCYGPVLQIKSIDGWGNFEGYCRIIEKSLDDGEKVLIVFDADKNCRKRKSELERIMHISGIDNRNSEIDIFLLPNNEESGKIESLLEKIIRPEHTGIFDCFEAYKQCLKEKDKSYKFPNEKAKIYSYKEALGAIEKGREHHFKQEYWNFESTFLNPLKTFLVGNIPPA